jgi:2',3'-cyclic-nucleotide 2'-phosphodiesterase (5'-nucleotidase family)
MKIKNIFVFFVVLALLSVVVQTQPVVAEKPVSVNVQILAVNDFHGALDPSLTKPSSTD